MTRIEQLLRKAAAYLEAGGGGGFCCNSIKQVENDEGEDFTEEEREDALNLFRKLFRPVGKGVSSAYWLDNMYYPGGEGVVMRAAILRFCAAHHKYQMDLSDDS